MYALIDTMTKHDPDCIGHVLSAHRTVEAAEQADDKLQRLTKKYNSQNSYVPTIIRKVINGKAIKGRYLHPNDVEEPEY